MEVKKDDIVRIEYTGTLENGEVFDKTEGRGPFVFKAGAQQVIPGFDEAVIGMKKGEEKEIHIPSDKGYGPRREELKRDVPRADLPKDLELKEGGMLALRAPTGQTLPAKILKVTEENVTLDLNHPLAGKDLTFKIKVTGINEEGDKDPACADESCSSCSSCNH